MTDSTKLAEAISLPDAPAIVILPNEGRFIETMDLRKSCK